MEKFFLDLLNWVGQSPARILVILVMVLMFGGAWFVYTEKDAFMASYRAQQALPHMNGQYKDASDFIFKHSQAELVAIFEVNTLLNTRKLAYFVTRKGGHNKDYDGYDVGLLTKNFNNNNDVIGLMSGKVPCSEYKTAQSFLGFIYKEDGVNYMCRISVPAEPGLFIGQISVGWKEEPSDIDSVTTVLNVASSILYKAK
jgi:hypothetical protein